MTGDLLIRSVVAATLLGCVPSHAVAQFGWVEKLFEKVEGVYLFGASPFLAAMHSQPLVPDNLHEYGFELVVDLFPSEKPSSSSSVPTPATYASGQCRSSLFLFGMYCSFQTTASPVNRSLVLGSDESVTVTPRGTRDVSLVAYDATGRSHATLARADQPEFTWRSQDPAVATVTPSPATTARATITGVARGETRVIGCLNAGASSGKNYTAFTQDYCVEMSVTVQGPSRDFNVTVAVGYALTSGFRARDPSLDLIGSIQSFPTFSIYVDPDIWLFYVGGTLGLANLHNARATLPGAPPTAVLLEGQTLEVGLALGIDFGPVFIEGALRRREWRAVKWSTAGAEIVPPPNWFRSLDMTTILLRAGVASSDVVEAFFGK